LDTPTDEESSKSIAAGGEAVDELYDEAVETVVSAGKGSASLLQRRLSIGYARAARILDELEKNGIVGPSQGSKARDVLVDSVPLPEGEGPPGGEIRTPRINLDDEDY
jgi:S-DNA-T family DNA segregation ATPase FtsK/SpoIIIE